MLALQLDPYYVAPLWPDAVSLAALQARALLDAGRYTERDFAEVAARSRARRASEPDGAGDAATRDVDDAARASRTSSSPLRKHDCPPISDGAAAIVLAAGDLRAARVRAAGVDPRHRSSHRAARRSARAI